VSSQPSFELARQIASTGFAALLGTEVADLAADRICVKMPYREALGVGRIHGGAISGLVDIAATAAFWADEQAGPQTRGATVDFTIHFLSLAAAVDLYAYATVRRRGGTLCVGDVCVRDDTDREVAIARVTYKMNR
jgi:uncharacterized protein (TIGR00369 family)